MQSKGVASRPGLDCGGTMSGPGEPHAILYETGKEPFDWTRSRQQMELKNEEWGHPVIIMVEEAVEDLIDAYPGSWSQRDWRVF
jgi:hypothetical protein